MFRSLACKDIVIKLPTLAVFFSVFSNPPRKFHQMKIVLGFGGGWRRRLRRWSEKEVGMKKKRRRRRKVVLKFRPTNGKLRQIFLSLSLYKPHILQKGESFMLCLFGKS